MSGDSILIASAKELAAAGVRPWGVKPDPVGEAAQHLAAALQSLGEALARASTLDQRLHILDSAKLVERASRNVSGLDA